MPRERRAITAFFFFFLFLKINVVISSFIEIYKKFKKCLSNPPFPLLFPKSCGEGCVGGWTRKRVSVYVSE